EQKRRAAIPSNVSSGLQDHARHDAGMEAHENKKYTMPIELIKEKIQIFSTSPTTETQKDRKNLWDLFTTNRESLTKEK